MNQSIINAIRESSMGLKKVQGENQRLVKEIQKLVKENQNLKDEKNELVVEISEVMNALINIKSELEITLEREKKLDLVM